MTKYVTDVGGNVGESQASKLGSYFSLMMLVDVPENNVDGLMVQLREMQDISATVHVVSKTPTAAEGVHTSKPLAGYSGQFILEGADNPGIVHKVTSILARNGLSIEKLETAEGIAPHGGTTLFRMKGVAHAYEPISAGFSVDRVRNELEAMGDELNCDIDLIDMPSGSEGVMAPKVA